MQTLEIVRLELIFYGIGLLPFTYVALLLALILHATNGLRGRIRARYWIAANAGVFTGLMAVSVVKVVGLLFMESNNITRQGSKYPMSDQVIDVIVMAGVFLALAVIELLLGVWKKTRNVANDGSAWRK